MASSTLAPQARLAGLNRLLNWRPRTILLVVVTTIISFLVIPPIGMLVFSTFRSTGASMPFEATAFTFANYVSVFSSGSTYHLLLNTIFYTLGTVAVCLPLTALFAWFLERTNVPYRRFLFILLLAPIGMPGIIASMAWIPLANPTNGLINQGLQALFNIEGPGPINIYSIPGFIWVSALRLVPSMYLMISGVFGRMDPTYEEASKVCGAPPLDSFRRISLPLLAPALLGATIYYITLSMETFEIPAMLGMPRGIFVFSTAIYAVSQGGRGGLKLPDYGLASTYSIVLLIVSAVLIYLYGRHVRRTERFATVTGRGYRPKLIDLKQWKFIPVLAMCAYFVFAVGVPLLMLIWTSLSPRFAPISIATLPLLNLGAYSEMLGFKYLWTAAGNTLVIAVATALGTMLLATLISWLSVRSGMRGIWSVPEKLSFVILGVPGVVLCMALIFIYAALPVPIYGTVWIIALALMTMALTFGTRLMTASLLQVHRELEEAASTSGANLQSTFFRIILPLLWPSFGRGFLWVFVFCLANTTIPLMLHSAGNQTIAVALWYTWVEDMNFPLASAIAVPLVLITSVLAFFIGRNTMLQGRGG